MTFIPIRRVCETDAEAITHLLNEIIQNRHYTSIAQTITVQEQIDFIRNFPPRGVYHIALDAESQAVLGIQDIMPSEAESLRFQNGEISTFVKLDSLRRGAGAALSQATFKAAKALGFRKLRATIRADNPGALAFYQAMGFREIRGARRQIILNERKIDQVWLEKLLES